MSVNICDVPGCGLRASVYTDGDEADIQGMKRPALPKIFVCDHHSNWPHSDDAKLFALTSSAYKTR